MSDLFGRTDGSPSIQEEMLKALVGKVVDLGASVKENVDQTRKMVGYMEEMREMKERMAVQEKQMGEMIQKEAEVLAEVQQVAGKIDVPVEKIELLEGTLQRHGQLFEKPLDKTVHYHHFVGKAIWVLAGLVIITACSLGMMVYQWDRAQRYVQDEMKWRDIKLNTDTTVAAAVHWVERYSQMDPDGLARIVQREEQRRAELTKNLIREQEARKRIEELQKQGQ